MGKLKKATGIDIAAPVKAVQSGISSIGNATGISPALTKVFQPVEKAIVQPVGQGLASLDRAVGKAIPGGWGTVASVAASMIPGGQFAALGLSKSAALGGLGALTGSGVLRKGGNFNLQGALIGGALAYGSAKLASGLEGAANTVPSATVDTAGNLTNAGTQSALAGTSAGYTPSSFLSGTSLGAGQGISSLTPTANALAGAGDFVAPAFTGGASGGISGLSTAAAPASFGLQAAMPAAGSASIGLGNIAVKPTLMQSAGNYLSNLPSNIANKASGAFDALTTPSNYSDFAKDYASNVSNIGEGAKNLITGAPGASAGFKAAGATLSNTALPIAFGMQGMTALDEQRKFLNEQKAAGNMAQAEYDAAMAEIDRSVAVARDAVARNPFNSNPDRSATMGDTDYRRAASDENMYGRFNPSETLYAKGGEVEHFFLGGLSKAIGAIVGDSAKGGIAAGSPVGFQNLRSEGMPSMQSQGLGSIDNSVANALRGASSTSSSTPVNLGITLYDRRSDKNRIYDDLMNKNYAVGGSIDDESGMDEARGLYQGNLSNGFMNMGSTPAYAAGGQPRFLSGGGDGMSDSIKASINGTQEARLADGEFVIPADVVSHLGNGSSKAGAKRLYSMMDKVRSARTGTKQQGKQINPKQFMPA